METAMLSPADAMLLGQRGGDGWGNNGSWIWVLLLAFLWTGNGFGGYGNRGGSGMAGNLVDGSITRAAVNEGFQYNQLDNGIRGITNGLCDGFYALNNSVKDGAYMTTGAIKDCCCNIEREIADCCCTTNRNVDALRFDISKGFCDVVTSNNLNTRDILEAQNASTQKILDYMCANEKQALRDRIQTLETNAMLQNQSTRLVDTLRPCPIPAYPVCNPYTGSYPSYGFNTSFGGFGGYGAGCGCGCGI